MYIAADNCSAVSQRANLSSPWRLPVDTVFSRADKGESRANARNSLPSAAERVRREQGALRGRWAERGMRLSLAPARPWHPLPLSTPFRLLFRRAQWKHPGAIETHGHLLHFNNGFPSPSFVGLPRVSLPTSRSTTAYLSPAPIPSTLSHPAATFHVRATREHGLHSRFTTSFMVHTVREHAEVPYG